MNTSDPHDAPRLWGWPRRGGGRAGHVEAGNQFAGTTSQVCGLFPFALASGSDVRGVPVGRHLHTAEPVGLDPAHWLRTGLVSNTGVWVQGQPGIGKSSITKRMLAGLVAFGMRAVVPGDVKGEYTPLVTALGGAVWHLGRGLHALNPLDAGPLRPAIAGAPSAERTRLVETLRSRRLSLLEALVTIVRHGEPDVTERRLLGAALDLAVETTDRAPGGREPLIPDVLAVLLSGPAPLLSIAATDDQPGYRRTTRALVNALGLLCEGAIRGIFDRPSSARFDPDTPALSLDISALDDDDDDVVAAAMLCSWAWSAALADAAAHGERRRNVVQVQDELWRALRVAPGLVERSDRITRLGRHRGVVSFQVTHSMDDLDALPTEADRAKARGLASRNGVLLLGGMAESELDGLRRITSLSDGEAALITSWAAPPTWHAGRLHPGRGKYLIKSGQRVGLPVALTLTPSERALHDTDGAFSSRRSRDSRVVPAEPPRGAGRAVRRRGVR
ncbi:ATPase [Pseudonocardia hydrocarbonoxydans]